MTTSIEQLRQYLPAAEHYRFLNYAATAPLLQPSAEVMTAIIQQNMEPMSKHFDQWLSVIESARNVVAKTINANVDEITFTTNTSMGLSMIATSIDWKEGDRIIYPVDDFPSNRFVWENLRSKGVVAEALDSLNARDFLEALKVKKLDRVRLVALSAVSYLDGKCADIKAVTDFCHAHNILVAVDGIQAVGAIPMDVHHLGCDFLACGGQKWLLGPVGSGFLYIRKDLINTLFVPHVGWASSRQAGIFDASKLEFVDGARRFEPGLPDVASIAGLAKSLEILSSTGWENVFKKIQEHNVMLIKHLRNIGYEPINQDFKNQSGIVTIQIQNDQAAEDLHQALNKERIIITQSRRHNRRQIRIAAHATTSKDDIDILCKILKKHAPMKRMSHVNHEVSEILPQESKMTVVQSEKCALITGASRGLGEAIAKSLAKRGYHLILLGRDEEKLMNISENLKREYEVKIQYQLVDFTSKPSVEKWLSESKDLSNVDVLINNAALAEAELFAESDLNRLRNMFEVNFFTPLAITQKVLPGMLEKKEGWILNIVTSGARCSLPLFSGYSSSKSALWSWGESLGRELAEKNITVTAFLPPHMETATQRQLGRKALGYYKWKENHSLSSVDQVAEQALEGLFLRKSTTLPIPVRMKLVLNILLPGLINNFIRRNSLK